MRVAVVAGFQGVSDTDRTTTLGRAVPIPRLWHLLHFWCYQCDLHRRGWYLYD